MNKNNKICQDCSNCIPIGEGDHICDMSNEGYLVLEDYIPTEKFMWCKGKCFEK